MIVPIISIPKSGTHYVNEVVKQLRPNNFGKAFACNFHHINDEKSVIKTREEIESLSRGFDTFCYLGHWEYSEEAHNTLAQYKPIFIYRHPLDVAVSFVEGAENKLFYDDVVRYFKRLPTKTPKYLLLLHGLPKSHPHYGKHPWLYGLKSIIINRIAWIHSEIPSVRYEDLINNNEKVLSLANYLETDFYSLSEAIDKATRNNNSDTFRKGGIANWHDEMPDEVKDIYIKELGDIIKVMGYEV